MPSPDEATLGLGFIVIPTPEGDDIELYVDEKIASLNGIANLINTTKNSPVQASVLQDLSDKDRPWRLVVTGKKDGEANHIDFPDFYFMSGDEDIWVDDKKDSQNAYLEIDGFPIESQGNKIKDFLSGVNLQLKQASPDKLVTLTITEDPTKMAGKMKAVVDQVNGVLEFINKQNAVDKDSDTRTMFTGDTSLQTVEWRLRNLMHEGFPVQMKQDDEYSFVFMHEMGVEFGKDGKLTFSEEKFQKALDGDFSRIAEAITSDNGFAHQLKEVFAMYTRPGDGLLANKEVAMKGRIKAIDQSIEVKERNLERRTQSLKDQFSKLQGSLAQMQQQQQYLTSALGGGGGNMISQLLGG
jgi:flagellar hook-associated protein 2